MVTADVTMPPFIPDFRLLNHLGVAEREWLAAAKPAQRGRWDRGHWGVSRQNISTRLEKHQDIEERMGIAETSQVVVWVGCYFTQGNTRCPQEGSPR